MTEPVHATTPALAEPRTPLWLPALGAALFLTAGLLWAATPAPVPVVVDEATDAGIADAARTAPSASVAASARPVPTALAPSPSASAVASAAASGALQRIMNRPPRVPRLPKAPPGH